MRNKNISITDELYIKLQTENNASGLIVSLLEDYYSKGITKQIKTTNDVNMKINELEQQKKMIEEQQTKQKRIDECTINPKMKEWLLSLEIRPSILAINDHIKLYDIVKVAGDLEMYGKAYDYLHSTQ